MPGRDPLTRQLDLDALERQLSALRAVGRTGGLRRPRRGWVRAIREALGMNGRQLAERLGIARSHLAHIETAELKGRLTLTTLERAAEALGCTFVYAIVPRDDKTLQQIMDERAHEVAASLVRRIDTSMALEAQGVTSSDLQRKEITRVAAELVRTRNRRLWDR
jgi:predicted DNA-binding mobile mystery protein A